MKLIEYTDIDEYLSQVQEYLMKNEARSNLALGIALQIKKDPLRYPQHFLAAVFDLNDQPILVALMTMPYPLIVQGEHPDPKAIDLLIDYLLQHHFSLSGVNGPHEFSDLFSHQYTLKTGVHSELVISLRNYELKEVLSPPLPKGKFRLALANDEDIIQDFLLAFHAEAVREGAPPLSKSLVQKQLQQGSIFAWEVDNEIVSIALKSRPCIKTITVGGVFTPPAKRNKGYASACVARLCQLLLDQGYERIVLFTDLSNPTSNAIYQRIGFKPVCDYHQYAFK